MGQVQEYSTCRQRQNRAKSSRITAKPMKYREWGVMVLTIVVVWAHTALAWTTTPLFFGSQSRPHGSVSKQRATQIQTETTAQLFNIPSYAPRNSFLTTLRAKKSKNDDDDELDGLDESEELEWDDGAVLGELQDEIDDEDEEEEEDDTALNDDKLIDAVDDEEEDDDDTEYDPFAEDEDEIDDEESDDSVDEELLDEEDILASQSLGPNWKEDGGEDEEDEDDFDDTLYGEEDAESAIAEEWEEDDGEGEYPLEDDPEDSNYQIQKGLLQQAAEDAARREADRNFDALEFIRNQMTPEMAQEMEQLPLIQEVNERTKHMEITEEDIADLDLEKETAKVSDYMDDPYPRHDPGEVNLLTLEGANGLTDDDMEEADNTWKMMRERASETPWDKVMLRAERDLEGLSNETIDEMEACLMEIGGSSYNSTRWLLYDLDFNVTNLMLAAVKHNREAPILFQHWYPQLVTYSRYASAQARNFDFTWEEVENADMSELERYYAGIGYDEIPNKAPAETGIIEFDYLDEEEIKMAAFADWVEEVYNPEIDRKDFDDDEWRDEDNVFSDFYEPPNHPDRPTFEDAQEDIAEWREEAGTDEELADYPEDLKYRDYLARDIEYDVVEDEEFEREFRGHLVVACPGEDANLEIAEKITARMAEEFGKQIFVETRVIGHAQEEDNVFEVWLESYEIDLLHSKKRATSNTKDWNGPAECDDGQIDYLVERVRFLISDDARYSYRMDMEVEV